MTQAMQQSTPFSAPVEKFSLLRRRIFTGPDLADVKTLEASILRFGLLSPLVAAQQNGRLVIIDGRKRFAALRRLAFEGRLPATLKKIPYILASLQSAAESASVLVSSETLYKSVSLRFQEGQDTDMIAKALGISHQCVRDLISLKRVAPAIRKAFYQRQISFEVAKAYAAIPSRARQLILYQRLGQDASAEEILRAPRTEAPVSIAA